MSDELIYKVAEEIYIKQEEIKEQIVELKDQIQDSNLENKKQVNSILTFLKQNSAEMANITKLVNPVKLDDDYHKKVIYKLFEKSMPEYKKEKLELLNQVGLTKFKNNYLGVETLKKCHSIEESLEKGTYHCPEFLAVNY